MGRGESLWTESREAHTRSGTMNSLTILITNQSLWFRSGTETYVRDLATGLLNSGHTPVVFSPQLGEIAEEIRTTGITVVDDLAALEIEPDVIHGQHSLETASAILRFPETPAVFVCHDAISWHDTPPPFPQIRRYIAVDGATQERLVQRHGIPSSSVQVVHNAVDLDRFLPERRLADRPQHALVFSNYMHQTQLTEIQSACVARGISLDAVGERQGNKTSTPETLLPGYDLVFAKGRCAIEALACGVAVIVCDAWGCGPLVTSAEFSEVRRANFGRRLCQSPLCAEFIGQQIDRYDARDAAVVTSRVRSECGVDGLLKQVLEVYRAAISERISVSREELLAATSQSIHWWTSHWSRILHETHVKHAEELQKLCAPPVRLRFVPRMLRSLRKRQQSLANSILSIFNDPKHPDSHSSESGANAA